MATPEHCLYCFDSLLAELEHRDALSLDEVQKSYAAYLASPAQQATAASPSSPSTTTKKIPALRRLIGSPSSPASSSSSSSSSSKGGDGSGSPLGSGSSSSTSLSDNTAASSISSASTAQQQAAGSPARERVTDPEACYPLFVTWDKHHTPTSAWHLRGCIGTFSASDPLSSTLSEYAIISALHDTRFSRVSLREVPALRCSVTLLTNFEECADVDDWTVGEHGIRISFNWEGRRYGSTYLPSVAPEQGWDREQTMVSLMRKAGWEGRKSSWRDVAERSGMRVERYRGDKEEVEYAEFKAWREWVDANWKGADDE